MRREGAFSYRKGVEPRVAVKILSSDKVAVNRLVYKNNTKLSVPPQVVSGLPARKIVKETLAGVVANENYEGLLIKATQLADRGKLEEAGWLCEKHLGLDAFSAEAYYLLAVIREAQGHILFSQELLQRALYLDPKHYQALIHLAGHAERQGDLVAAAAYRARAKRLVEND